MTEHHNGAFVCGGQLETACVGPQPFRRSFGGGVESGCYGMTHYRGFLDSNDVCSVPFSADEQFGAGDKVMAQRVNLDAMIPRADFGALGGVFTHQQFKDFPLLHLEDASPIRAMLRKPDFQRETNHWTPEQVKTFVASFVDGELIPSLILWRSALHVFVIDGGHRLSALRGWMYDDYGDGPISIAFYGAHGISDEQVRAAKRTRTLIENSVGRYSKLKGLVGANLDDIQTRRVGNVLTRALDHQWVEGTPDVAEISFFKINSQGTPLDDVEEMLLRNRTKAIAISARAILRAGTGNKYWSKFPTDKQEKIEKAAAEFHELLFDPEADVEVRTVELPIGGTVLPANALALLVDFLTIASTTQAQPRNIDKDAADIDGSDTLKVLKLSREIGARLAGNNAESLGLHPAVYFYNERGVYARHLFLGMARLIAERVRNNDSGFFKKFTNVRKQLEDYLVANKSLIGQAFANINRDARVLRVRDLLNELVKRFDKGETFTTEDVLATIGLGGRILDVKASTKGKKVSEATKAALAISAGLKAAPECPICKGLLYTKKSVSYDHDKPAHAGGTGAIENIRMTHPYCNTGIKGGAT